VTICLTVSRGIKKPHMGLSVTFFVLIIQHYFSQMYIKFGKIQLNPWNYVSGLKIGKLYVFSVILSAQN
jgi:hypothetical protein